MREVTYGGSCSVMLDNHKTEAQLFVISSLIYRAVMETRPKC